VRAALAAEGVQLLTPPRPGADTGFCIAMVEPDGERTFVTMPGVETALDAADLAAVVPEPGDLVALSGYDLAYPASGPVLADWVDALPVGTLLALDPGPLVLEIPATLLARVLGRVGLLTMNQREARLLGGAAELHDRPGQLRQLPTDAILVVREGAAGCVASGGPLGGRQLRVPAPEVTAVDTTGAGDTHTGVLLAALASGRDLADALSLANRAAAISVTRIGPATAPKLADADLQPG
jgi:ribokinase